MSGDYPEQSDSGVRPEAVASDAPPADGPVDPTFDLSIFIEPQGILCKFQCEGRRQEWSMPRTVVRRAHKAMTVDHVFDLLGAGPIVGYFLREAVTNEPEFLLVPRAVNALTDRVTKALRRVQKTLQKAAKAEAEEGPPEDNLAREWREEFEAAAQRPLALRFRYAFIRTYKPVLDDASFRAFDTTAEYRRWCEENLPDWLGYGRV